MVTDHKALTHLFSSTVLNAKLWRWALYLQQFCIDFRYLPGRFNVVADCLSRQTWPSSPTASELPDALSTAQVVALQDRAGDKDFLSQDHLKKDRSLPLKGGGGGGRCGSTLTISGPSHIITDTAWQTASHKRT